MKTIQDYIEENKDRFIDELFGLLRIPSISSEAERQDMYRVAEYWKNQMLNAGINRAEVMETEGHPVVFGEKTIDKALPTILVYGHMDVMPVEPIAEWKTKPFEPVIIDGKIWGRGSDDDKGQSFMHAKAVEYLIKNNLLKCNVKFLIEGEEEMGSPSLSKFCKEHKELLKCDTIIVSDSSLIASDVPSITVGLRGLAYWQIEVTGAARDLHSGIYGGAVGNPINALCKIIARLTDENNKITIPGFYDKVVEFTPKEREQLNKMPFDAEAYKASLHINSLQGEEGYSTVERTGIRPSFDVCGIWGGYTGDGPKTVIPAKAFAKLSCRLVAKQNYSEVASMMQSYIEKIAPKSVSVKIEFLHGGEAYQCPISHPAYLAAEKAYIKTFGKKPIPFYSGGSIPIIAAFEDILGVKSILMGFGLDSDAIHAPNENYPLFNFYKGIETIAEFYQNLDI